MRPEYVSQSDWAWPNSHAQFFDSFKQTPMNKAAQALGKLAKGKTKTLTKAERKRRKESLALAREKRWLKKDGVSSANAKVGRHGEQFENEI